MSRALIAMALAALLAVTTALGRDASGLTRPAAALQNATTASVSIDTTQPGTTVGTQPIGINLGPWSSHNLDSGNPTQLATMGASLVRFPSGSYSDAYDWVHNRLVPGQQGYIDPNNTWPNTLSRLILPAGAQPMVTVNYGTSPDGTRGGNASFAAAWVADAKARGLHGGIWEVGNETYGNGYYGICWEPDRWAGDIPCRQKEANPALSPSAYATNAATFVTAMKAVDPSITVLLVLAGPDSWFDTTTRSVHGKTVQAWNPTVLSKTCGWADGYTIHYYPQEPYHEDDAKLLQSPEKIAARVATLQQQFAQYCPGHRQPPTYVTETNSVSSQPGKQTTNLVNALYASVDAMAWAQGGLQSVDWWNLYNGGEVHNHSSSLYGSRSYGDYGVLSSGTVFKRYGWAEPPVGTPFPDYWGLALAGRALQPGSRFVAATTSTSDLVVYSTLLANGHVTAVLLNRSASTAYDATISFNGFTPQSGTATWIGEKNDSSPQSGSVSIGHGQATFHLDPYTDAVLDFQAAP
ncbi:MAG TPA: hypothetical protein VKX16_08125 [Chloroflexota bacterium]|nr:hypothetical protein [Chloroflexota bacterium]